MTFCFYEIIYLLDLLQEIKLENETVCLTGVLFQYVGAVEGVQGGIKRDPRH